MTGCGADPALTKADYVQAFDSVTTTYNEYINEPEATGVASLRASVDESDLIAVDRASQMARMSTACVQFVGFLKNLCENQTFEITTDFQEMVVVDTSMPNYVGNYKLRVKMSYDSETSVISSEVYCEDGSYISYLVFEILFDFSTDILDYFTITGAMGSGTLTSGNVNYFKFEDNSLEMLSPTSDSFVTYAQSILDYLAVVSGGEWGTDLPDYSQEYVDAMLGNA